MTNAEFRVRQGKEVTWTVSADGYISKSETVRMTGNRSVNVSLDPAIVTFTINTNVSSTITINGDVSTGVKTKSVTVRLGSTVSWSVAAAEYDTQSGTENNVRSAVTKNITLVFNGVTSICKSGYIWCTDGSFVDPAKFSSSGKTAYGYALSSTAVARITKAASMSMAWGVNGSRFYGYLNGSSSLTDGVFNCNILKSIDGYSSTNCPAIYYACTQVNAGVTSYMPAIDELSALYNSIMSGNMKDDLTTAGIYESCNYRIASNNDNESFSPSDKWHWIWSSTEKSADHSWSINFLGNKDNYLKFHTGYCVIPFFRF